MKKPFGLYGLDKNNSALLGLDHPDSRRVGCFHTNLQFSVVMVQSTYNGHFSGKVFCVKAPNRCVPYHDNVVFMVHGSRNNVTSFSHEDQLYVWSLENNRRL